MVIVIMGAAGAGKSTVGRALAASLRWPFVDADELHDPGSIQRMSLGVALTDAERLPWLERVHAAIAGAVDSGTPLVVACSALRGGYRRVLVGQLDGVRFVYLRAPRELLAARVGERTGHFAPATLVDSQIEALEPPGGEALTLDAARPVAELVAAIRTAIKL